MTKQELFAKRLSELIKESGKGITEIARDIGISHSNISQWLALKRSPQLDALWLLAEYFNCSIDYLVGKTDY